MEDKGARLEYLFGLYLEDRLSPEEYDEFHELAAAAPGALEELLERLWEGTANARPLVSRAAWESGMAAHLRPAETPLNPGKAPLRKIRRPAFAGWAAAAAVVLALGALYLLTARRTATKPLAAGPLQQQHDILPGGNKALLTLANGSTIALDSIAAGDLALQGAARVMKSDSNRLTYHAVKGNAGPAYNTLTTPRGGQYALTLADGSRVWLNAGSSIRFPTAFTGNERKVEITGEAYFEIAADARHIFRVYVNGIQVEVLGTSFNIMAYNDEAAVKTTLLNGAVRIVHKGAPLQLKPGQQAQVLPNGQAKLVPAADVQEAIAWRSNLFWFNNADMPSVMRQVARWYNVDVVIRGSIPWHFTGSIPRNVNVSKVFEILQEAGNIHFDIRDGKIIVSP